MATTIARWTATSVSKQMNRRGLVRTTDEGKTMSFTAKGKPTQLSVTDKDGNYVPSAANPDEVLQKWIINVNANSQLAMQNPRTKQLLSDAIAKEKAGENADEEYQAFLNATQVSFNVLNEGVASQLTNNCEFSAKVVKITTENGSLLTLDATTVRILAPGELAQTKFDIEELLGGFGGAVDDGETDEAKAEREVAEKVGAQA